MNPLASTIKTTEDMLLNYTNIEVKDGVYINNTLVKLFKNIERELKFLKIEKGEHYKLASYKYNISPETEVNIYTNAKHDHLELVHFYDIPDFFDDNYMDIINIANRNLHVAKAVSAYDDMSSVEVSAMYNGDFSAKGFLKFMQTYHQDVINFHKVNSIYLNTLLEEIDKARLDKIIKKSVGKVIKKVAKKTVKKVVTK